MAMFNEATFDRKERKVLVITRLLLSFGEPVVTSIEFVPEFTADAVSIEQQEATFIEKRTAAIKEGFCKMFVEFNQAAWKGQITTILD